jgi:hypothetical protein
LERPAIEELSAIAVADGVILWSQLNVMERRGNEEALRIGRICPSPALPVLGDDNRPKSDGGRYSTVVALLQHSKTALAFNAIKLLFSVKFR